MIVKERMREKLMRGLEPHLLEVIDDSSKHAGHAGAAPGGETHFSVKVVSHAFSGKSRLDRHRMVNALLAEELAGGVHALAIEARAPGE